MTDFILKTQIRRKDIFECQGDMKNKYITIIIIVLCLLALSTYIVKLTNDLYKSDREEIVLEYYDSYIEKYTFFHVEKGIFVVSDTVIGQVVFEEDAIQEYHADKTNVADVKVQVGQSVKKGDTLCISGKKTIIAETDGKIIDLDESDGVRISLLDYTKSYIVAHIPEGRQKKLCENTPITAQISGEEMVAVRLRSIEPIIDSNGFIIKMNNVFQTFENTLVKIHIEYEQKENAIVVPKEYVKFTSYGEAYVTVGNSSQEDITKHTVLIGDENNDSYELLGADALVGTEIVYDKKDLALNGN